jgi:isopenicillin N synthase-like dioxygenase
VNEYAKVMGEIDRKAKRMVFESYGLENQLCDSFIGTSNYLLRFLKYRAAKMDETNLGLYPHSDITTITVVHQLSNLNGLEIKMNDGTWTAIATSPSMFVVLPGDTFHVSL